jgi:glycosyltransferase involved in cell wall biosynthesis
VTTLVAAAFFAHGPAARAFAATLGLDPRSVHEGCSAVEGLDAFPLPGLAAPRLTFTGRFREDKGPDLLIEALPLLADELGELPHCYLVGDGPMRPWLQRRSHELGLAKRVRFTGWTYHPAGYVAGAAVHVVPSREEAWSQSAVVAMGLGVPVVGIAVEGLPLTLGEGRGLLVAPGDPARSRPASCAASNAPTSTAAVPTPRVSRPHLWPSGTPPSTAG